MQNRIMNETSYFGIKTWKSPIDAWVYQEIILPKLNLTLLLKLATLVAVAHYFLLILLDLMGMDNSQVIGIDISHKKYS